MWLLVVVGTGLLLLGFIKRPKGLADLILPRFAMPALFWLVGIFPALYFDAISQSYNRYENYRKDYGEGALLFIVLCFLMFWVGFSIPSRMQGLARALGRSALTEYPRALRRIALLIVTATFVFMFLVNGGAFFQEGWGEPLISAEWAQYIQWQLVVLLNVVAAVFFGLGWPDEDEPKTLLFWLALLYVLFIASTPLFAKFSRASGIMPLLVLIGYAGRRKRLPFWASVFALVFAFVSGQVGLSGRGISGHYAGFLPYLAAFFQVDFGPLLYPGGAVTAADAFTPVCVVLRGLGTNIDMHAIDSWSWIIFQVPVPHIFWFWAPYTFDPTEVIGGVGAWHYTSGMFGDAIGHLGWWGCLAFLYMGWMYRLLENLVTRSGEAQRGANLVLLTLPISYFAFLTGSFHTFRAWVSTFTFGIGLALVFLWLANRVVRSPVDSGEFPELEVSPAGEKHPALSA